MLARGDRLDRQTRRTESRTVKQTHNWARIERSEMKFFLRREKTLKLFSVKLLKILSLSLVTSLAGLRFTARIALFSLRRLPIQKFLGDRFLKKKLLCFQCGERGQQPGTFLCSSNLSLVILLTSGILSQAQWKYHSCYSVENAQSRIFLLSVLFMKTSPSPGGKVQSVFGQIESNLTVG